MTALVWQPTVTCAPTHHKPDPPRVTTHVVAGDARRYLHSSAEVLHYFCAVPALAVIVLLPISQHRIVPQRTYTGKQLPSNPAPHALPRQAEAPSVC